MRILSLDLGTTTGWCVDTQNGTVDYGSSCFSVKNHRFSSVSMKFVYFRNWLNEMYEHKFDLLYYEAVVAHKGVDASHCYGGFLAMLQEWCLRRNIPFEGVPVGTIKKYITGNGGAKKQEVIEAVQKLGFNPGDDNAADAIALYLYSKNVRLGENQCKKPNKISKKQQPKKNSCVALKK